MSLKSFYTLLHFISYFINEVEGEGGGRGRVGCIFIYICIYNLAPYTFFLCCRLIEQCFWSNSFWCIKYLLQVYIVIPPAKRSFRGVYCFQPVRHSVIPSFRDSVIPSFRHSVNIWTSLLNNLSSFCLICFKFSPHLRHQTIHVWYEFRGQRVSIARVMGLFKSSYNMFAIVLKVHTL